MEQTDADGCSALFCVSVRLADQKWCQSMCMYLFSVLCNAAEFILLAALERKESNFRLLCSNFWLLSMGHGLQYDV